MKRVHISYNPYFLKTEITIEGIPISESSPLYPYQSDYRLQKWMASSSQNGIKGLFELLRSACGSDEIELVFHGTTDDFCDVKDTAEMEGTKFFKKVICIHENASTAANANPGEKLAELQKIYDKVMNGPVKEFRTPEIKESFNIAMGEDFEIIVAAPMSSGKSTLINAIMGQDLLPAINQATTAVITKIRDIDAQENFTVSTVDRENNRLLDKVPATAKLIKDLNNKIDPKDKDEKRSFIKEIQVEGNIPTLSSGALHTVFVDTPGGNNSLNEEHERVMEQAINDENKSMVLFIFNGTQVSTIDNAKLLYKIAEAMRKSTNGKQSRDRFLFVANRMDDYDTSEEPFDSLVDTIHQSLAKVGITNPNLFVISAQTAKLLRMAQNGVAMSKFDTAALHSACNLMKDPEYRLYLYSSLSEKQKNAFLAEEKKLQEHNENGQNDEKIVLINSGVPALELAINDYLRKYAIAIKLQQSQMAFMNVVNDKDMLSSFAVELNENKDKFEKVQAEVQSICEKLEKDTTLKDTVNKINAIHFDSESIRREADLATKEMQQDVAEYLDDKYSVLSPDKADKLAKKFEEQFEQHYKNAIDKINILLQKNVQEQCDQVMESYRQQMDSLRANGLTSIGDLKLEKLSAIKQAESFKDRMSGFEHTRVESYRVRVEDDGLLGGVVRFLGDLFDTNWGYHYEDRTRNIHEVYFKKYIQEVVAPRLADLLETIDDAIRSANKRVAEMKDAARNQATQLDSTIRKTMADIKIKTASKEALEKAVQENEETYKFAKEIVSQVETLLDI